MATINTLIEPVIRTPSLSSWARVKKFFLSVVEESPVIQALCCLDASELQSFRVDNQVRDAIREEMRLHMGYFGRETCVASAIDESLANTGYDLTDGGSIRKANKGVKRTMKAWDAYFRSIGVNVEQYISAISRESARERALIVPKFAAACALHLRCKLGILSQSEANILLVQRKYLELCRRHNVRDVDTVLHQQYVMNTVFTEGVLDELATTRRRLPRWVKWLDSLEKVQAVRPDVC